MLGIIRDHFERIHFAFESLPVTEYVPVPGHPEVQLKYGLLLKDEREGRASIAVDLGSQLEDLDVKQLLDGVDLPGDPRHQGRIETVQFAARPPLLFISYSRKDGVLLDQFRASLVPYERAQELEVWADQLIEAGRLSAAARSSPSSCALAATTNCPSARRKRSCRPASRSMSTRRATRLG